MTHCLIHPDRPLVRTHGGGTTCPQCRAEVSREVDAWWRMSTKRDARRFTRSYKPRKTKEAK